MTGTLGLFSLVDLFQLLASASRSGRLRVDHPLGAARIYFDRGDAVHAEFTEFEGEEAVFALFADERGAFEFTIGLPAPRVTIARGTQDLVLDAVRRVDEARREDDGAPLPDLDVVPEPEEGAERLSLGPEERAVLDLADRRRSLGRIAERLGRDPEGVARIAARLAGAGALRLQRRRPRTARLVVRAAEGAGAPATAGLDPAILDAWSRALGHPPREVVCRRDDGRTVRLRALARPGAGPFLWLDRGLLLRTGLMADQALLVRPYEEED